VLNSTVNFLPGKFIYSLYFLSITSIFFRFEEHAITEQRVQTWNSCLILGTRTNMRLTIPIYVYPPVSNFLKTRMHRRWAPFPFANAPACQGFLKSQGKKTIWFILLPEGTLPQITVLIDEKIKVKLFRNVGIIWFTWFGVRENEILDFSWIG
jgi:hypothetical protein